jgi:peptidoglycan hydrolase CwlO-like protein
MTIEIALLISIISVAFGVYSGIKNMSRNNRNDTVNETSQMTTVMVKLENIADGIHEIKSDMRTVKSDVDHLRERLTIVEQSVKSAHKRLDDLTHTESV